MPDRPIEHIMPTNQTHVTTFTSIPALTRRGFLFARRQMSCAIACLLAWSAAPAAAQMDPEDDPDLNSSRAHEAVDRLQSPQEAPVRVEPAGWGDAVSAQSSGGSDPKIRLLPEGAFLVAQRGVIMRGENDALVMVFESTSDDEPDLPVMTMQPCSRLTEMLRVDQSRDSSVVFEVNGQVFLFEGRNYLLPLLFTIAPDRAEGGTDHVESDSAAATPGETGADADEPDIDALFAKVAPGAAPRRHTPAAAGPADEAAASTELLREGTMIVSRRGRLSVGNGGAWMFTVDNDTDGSPEADQPLRLMPCANLEIMIDHVREHRGSLSFTISGQVFLFDGRNYLLPSVVLIESDREGNLVTAQ